MSFEHYPTRQRTGGQAAPRGNQAFDHDESRFKLEFITQKELAAGLRVSERTLERWRMEGSGPPFVKLGRILYSVRDVADWSQQNTFNSTAEAGAAR